MNSNDKVLLADGAEISSYLKENSPKVITAWKQNALLEQGGIPSWLEVVKNQIISEGTKKTR